MKQIAWVVRERPHPKLLLKSRADAPPQIPVQIPGCRNPSNGPCTPMYRTGSQSADDVAKLPRGELDGMRQPASQVLAATIDTPNLPERLSCSASRRRYVRRLSLNMVSR